ncbi:hypothetical protein SCUCBS95973_002897 [Sporothrix curviconia]|uniref:FAD-binding domain-containing protein n=1 Tax=Sporothrix curviconia TaxID=1260050 RepID=A0ABP0BB03_9PEZI
MRDLLQQRPPAIAVSENNVCLSVIIVGAGPVGLLTAINLVRANVHVLVLERGTGIDQSPCATFY